MVVARVVENVVVIFVDRLENVSGISVLVNVSVEEEKSINVLFVISRISSIILDRSTCKAPTTSMEIYRQYQLKPKRYV